MIPWPVKMSMTGNLTPSIRQLADSGQAPSYGRPLSVIRRGASRSEGVRLNGT